MDLSKEFIDTLEKTSEDTINRYQQIISLEIRINSEKFTITKARQIANLKYGKFWRDRLEDKKIYN